MSQRPSQYRTAKQRHPSIHDLVPERNIQRVLEQAASLLRYRWWHIPARAYQAPPCDACGHPGRHTGMESGFPDLVILGPMDADQPRLLMLECKTERGRATADQQAVMALLARVQVVEAGIVRPSSLDSWLRTLQEG